MSYGSYFALVLFLAFFAAVALNLAFVNTRLLSFLKFLAGKPEVHAAIQRRSLEQALNILTPVLVAISIGPAFLDHLATFEQGWWTFILIIFIIWWLWIQLLLFGYLVEFEGVSVLGTALYRSGYFIALLPFYFAWFVFLLTGDAIDILGVVMFADLLWRIMLAILIRLSSKGAT